MPSHAVGMILDLFEEGHVTIYGISYTPNVGDTRESPVYEMIRLLILKGIEVFVWDPIVHEDEKLPDGAKRFTDSKEAAKGASCVVLATAHQECLDIDWKELLTVVSKNVIFDGPRRLSKKKMQSIGWEYRGVGLPNEGHSEFN